MVYNRSFFVIIFIVSFLSDVFLNVCSHNQFISSKSSIIKSLRGYFDANNFIVSGIYAGITILVAVLITLIFTKLLFNIEIPVSTNELAKFLLISAIVGYFLDIAIYKFKVFGNLLDTYYKTAGAGFLGAFAYIFAVLCTYIICKFL
jgi:hypothetical protein